MFDFVFLMFLGYFVMLCYMFVATFWVCFAGLFCWCFFER